MLVRRAGRVFAALLLPAFAACSFAFSPDELSQGVAGSGGTGGAASGPGASVAASSTSASASVASSSGHPKVCEVAADCDDHNPCTNDVCDPMTGCTNAATPGAVCGQGTDCTPAATCTAQGVCAPGQPDASKCDDGNVCTIDACTATGCTHAANTGAACNDGNPCDMVGVCNGQGTCVGSPIPNVDECAGQNPCPSGFYATSFSCNGFCGGCPLCINAFTCKFACTPKLLACCGNDCNTACPAGYHISAGPMDVDYCGCNAMYPGKQVECSL